MKVTKVPAPVPPTPPPTYSIEGLTRNDLERVKFLVSWGRYHAAPGGETNLLAAELYAMLEEILK
jgi:hypothetical protein